MLQGPIELISHAVGLGTFSPTFAHLSREKDQQVLPVA
jgi:hypothetical protein